MSIRVLIAEDEELVRDALAELVASDPSMTVVGAVADAEAAVEVARLERPDVALLDVKMPGGGGPRAAREIREESPRTHIVALSAYEDRTTVIEMLRAGAVGYIVKGTPVQEILSTIRRSIRGQGSLSVDVTADVIHELASALERSETLAQGLEELNRTKSELIQVLAHEFFTPITTIQGAAMIVAQHGDGLRPAEANDLADGVAKASDRLRRLVGNIEGAARLDREGAEVSALPLTAGEMLVAAAAEFPREGDRLRLPPDPRRVGARLWADRDLGVRALVVVLENALALSGDEPVDVDVLPSPERVEFAVSDRGPGVSAEFRDRIFDAFTQADGSTTRAHEGLGIGLYLARRILSAHQGTIDVSPRDGGGSTFVLSFPAFEESYATGS